MAIDPSIVTPEVEAALAAAGPKVAAALGMDAAAGVADVATVGEAGLNPIADGAAVVATPIAAAKDAEAIAGAEGVLQALAKSPGGRAALLKSGKTIEEIAADVEKRGVPALKDALDSPAGKTALGEMKQAWDSLPAGVRGGIVGVGAYVGAHVLDPVVEKLQEYEKALINNVAPEAPAKAITISQGDGPQRPMAAGGLTGRVVGDDGKNVDIKVGRDTFTIHNLPPDRVAELTSHGNDMQHVSVNKEGRLEIEDRGQGGQQNPGQQQPQGAPGHQQPQGQPGLQQPQGQPVHAAAGHGGR